MRYAGDYFGVALEPEGSSSSSLLLTYFPTLRNTYKKKTKTEAKGPALTGNVRAAQEFGGFKLFEAPKTLATPTKGSAFAGFKPFEVPK